MNETVEEFDVRVLRRTPVSADVAVLEFGRLDAAPLPAWFPGAHLDLLLFEPAQRRYLERQYSLCGDPADRSRWRIAVLREPAGRGGSERIHLDLVEGATLRVRGPRNHFPFLAAPRYRFLAGGIGITPLMAMIAAADRAAADWRLDYAGRSRAAMAFLDELAPYGDRVVVHAGDEGARLDLIALLAVPTPDTLVYCCGPRRMIDAVEVAAPRWPDGAVRWERFEAKQFAEPVSQTSFEVELALSGLTLTVPPDRTILQIAEDAGVLVLSSCQTGTCGTCETPVLAGEVEHRDSVLTPAEQATHSAMMICCSRAKSPSLVLDL